MSILASLVLLAVVATPARAGTPQGANIAASSGAPSGYAGVTTGSGWQAALWGDAIYLMGSPVAYTAPDGSEWLSAVGFAPLDASAGVRGRLNARRVADANAKAALARFLGSTVETTSELHVVRTTTATSADGANARVSAMQKSFQETTREQAVHTFVGITEVVSWNQDGGATYAIALAMPVPRGRDGGWRVTLNPYLHPWSFHAAPLVPRPPDPHARPGPRSQSSGSS